jgi:hypothetical protein
VSTQATVVNGMQPEPGLDPLAAVEGSDDVAAVAGVLTPPDPSPSVLDIIERKLADADKSKRIELRMPVPHPLLEFNQMVANYRLLTDGDRAGLASRARERGANPDGSPKDNEQALELAADVLVTACVGIYVRQGEEYVLAVRPDGAPNRYDQYLAKSLGVKGDKATSILRAAFAGNGTAIIAQMKEHTKWATNPASDADPFRTA